MGDRPTDRRVDYRTRYLRLKSALYDRPTELPAFPALFDRLRTILDGRRRVGVLHLAIVDLDMVESLYGWQIFDRVLARVVAEARAAVGQDLPPGTLLSLNNIAGDQLVAFVPETPEGDDVDAGYLAEIGRKLARRVEAAFDDDDFAGMSPRLTFRVGHALLSQNPFYRFERRVYAALDEARSADDRRERRRALTREGEMQEILQGRGLETVFQPVVDLESGAVLGFEAFARGPKGSPVETPRAMFALSGRMGCEASLDRVCRDAALRASAGVAPPGKLFVNLLPSSADGRLRTDVVALLESLALEPADLVLEFSERGASDDLNGFVATLGELKEQGFGVALDDIGTGYASQGILEHVSPDYLKLDVSLVQGIEGNLIKQELLGSLVRIAERIGARVIGEGVETEAQARTLRRAGAHYGQGYLFAGPAPPGKARRGGIRAH